MDVSDVQVLVRATAAENRRLRQSLTYIKESLGGVCDDYATCSHKGCRHSHCVWEVADWGLSDPSMPWRPSWNLVGETL